MTKSAKCKECGGEVVFDGWVHLNGDVYETFDNNTCIDCRCNDVDYEEVDDEQ